MFLNKVAILEIDVQANAGRSLETCGIDKAAPRVSANVHGRIDIDCGPGRQSIIS